MERKHAVIHKISIYFNELKIFAVFLSLSLCLFTSSHAQWSQLWTNQLCSCFFLHCLSLSFSIDIQSTCKYPHIHNPPTHIHHGTLAQTPLSPYGFTFYPNFVDFHHFTPFFYYSRPHSLCFGALPFFGRKPDVYSLCLKLRLPRASEIYMYMVCVLPCWAKSFFHSAEVMDVPTLTRLRNYRESASKSERERGRVRETRIQSFGMLETQIYILWKLESWDVGKIITF